MKRFLFGLVFCLGCSTSGVPTGAHSDSLEVFDAKTEGAEISDLQSVVEAEVDNEAQKGCAHLLPKTQCVANENCMDFEACLGSFGCEEPPCYGQCDAYPGVCTPKPSLKSCAKNSDCPKGFLCQRFSPSRPDIRGICIQGPSPDACFSNEDCDESFVCAWAHVCDPFDICLAPDYPGRCLPAPPEGACYEKTHCNPDEHCEDSHVCSFDEKDCVSRMGVCKSGAAFGCRNDSDCSSESTRRFCVGSFTCESPPCSVSDKEGFCVMPVVAQCYTDSFCPKGDLCVSSFPCPPHTICAEKAYPGFCTRAVDFKPFVAISVEGEDFNVGETFYIVVINQSAVPVFLDPCAVVFPKVQDYKGEFVDLNPLSLGTCENSDAFRLVVLPPGKGFAVPFIPEHQGTYMVDTVFKIGCEQGVYNPTCLTTSQILEAKSMPFTVQ